MYKSESESFDIPDGIATETGTKRYQQFQGLRDMTMKSAKTYFLLLPLSWISIVLIVKTIPSLILFHLLPLYSLRHTL